MDIGSHVFPTSKYRLIKESLIDKKNLKEDDFIDPGMPDLSFLKQVHTDKYVNDIKNGTLSIADEIRLELPYSKKLAEASFICSNGTMKAGYEALKTGVGIHLGGGFHHSYPDHGEGFCVFNDIAVCAVQMLKKIDKILIVDCDLHQGNGTAFIFKDNKNVFTFSIHQENNYPFHKEKSDLDVGVKDNINGREYNNLLSDGIRNMKKIFQPDLYIYVAGSDTYMDDQLGGLMLTKDDLRERDELVKDELNDIPAVVVLAGGYAKQLQDTVEIHSDTIIIFLKSK